MSTDPVLLAILALLLVVLLLLVWQARQLSELARKQADWAQITNKFATLQQGQEQVDRSVREEISRNRQEQSNQSHALRSEIILALTGMGDSLSAKVEGLTRSNDQKLELLRTAVEQRLDTFTDSAATSSARLQSEVTLKLDEFKLSLASTVRETHQLQRDQTAQITASLHSQSQQLREETSASFNTLGAGVMTTLTGISQLQQNELQELKATVDTRLAAIQSDNEKKLEQMRQTVDEKLQGTLDARLGVSFKQVSDRLEQVFKGLGEMQTLAAGVGDLKRVLTNVKTRGTWGEVQLGALLEQMLAPGQYGQNVATTGTAERVEYAVKLPGPTTNGAPVWLPIDAKFPVEDYQRLVDASERGDIEAVDRAVRQLETTLKLCAKNCSEKYIAPPATTDFGILFLSTEGLYAEAMRKPGLAEFIQREHRIVLAGPSTLAALLNSFQMGFRTLAIQQRSSEVWELLGTVKAEFGKYADVLSKIKRKLTEAHNTVEKAETRTRAIHRQLRGVESAEAVKLDEIGWIDDDPIEDAEREVRILVSGADDE